MNEENKEKQLVSDTVIDRYSILIVMLIISLILIIPLIKSEKIKLYWAFIPSFVTFGLLGLNAVSSSRIRRNEYDGEIYTKGENDCGFKVMADYKAIDGVMIQGTSKPPIYKTADGTDITIDKNGIIHPAGFGSRIIIKSRGFKNKKISRKIGMIIFSLRP